MMYFFCCFNLMMLFCHIDSSFGWKNFATIINSTIDPSFNSSYINNFLQPNDNKDSTMIDCERKYHLKDTLQLLNHWGYHGEKHRILTEDGYIFSIFRILSQKRGYQGSPILILHGFLASSELWLTRGNAKIDLPIVLMDSGYDVWLGNYRGGHNGREHINLNTEDEQFWNFSFHEHGLYDVPAMIDYILKVTGYMKLTVIGHSMGNTAFMVMCSMRPQYNEKVNLFLGMAPYVFAQYVRFTTMSMKFYHIFKENNKETKKTDLLRRQPLSPIVAMCNTIPTICHLIASFAMGPDPMQMDWKLYPILAGYFPSGSSMKTFTHLFQLKDHGRFCMFDYGEERNMEIYNSVESPDYDLSKVTVPVVLYIGQNDKFKSYRDFNRLKKSLPNCIDTIIVPNYNHLDFMIAKNSKEVLYTPMIKYIQKYTTS